MADVALRITETVAKLQKELKCGICCSTYKDPILSTCYHIFCRSCINACFERKRKVQCPICRSVLDKRSCRDSYQITMAVQNYLKLSDAFKNDIQNITTFKTLPPEAMFAESQAPLDVTIIPENDGKRCAPDFAIPLLPPVRRKRTSRTTPAPESEPGPSPAPDPIVAPPRPTIPVFTAPQPPKVLTKDVKKLKKDMETLTDPYKISSSELQNIDIQEQINNIRGNLPEKDEIDALFELIPSMRTFLKKNVHLLMERFGVAQKTTKKVEKSERRVSFANSQNLEDFRYPDPSTEESKSVKPTEKVTEAPKKIEKSTTDDDEIVEDSDGETQPIENDENDNGDGIANVTIHTNSTTLDADRTDRAIQDEGDRLDKELAQVPKTIVCSRIHNDEDEVELLSDFYHKFKSNACRFAESVDAHTTHLVMMNSEGRTIPQKSGLYTFAIARKCIIVGRQWLVDCLKTGLLLSEADYTITSCTSSIAADIVPSSGDQIGWLRSRNDENGKLFAGCRFMILRKFTLCEYFDYKELIKLVQLCGGEILSSYENLSPEKLFIIFSKHSKAIDESKNLENLYKCDVITFDWILDSISEYSLLPTDNYKAVNWIGND